jgi:hypothetical protein
MGIDTSMLAAMREAIAELLPDTGQIITITNIANGYGGVTPSRGTAAAIPCRVDVKQGREELTGGAVQPYTKTMLSLPYDTTISTLNEFLHNGTTYAVKSVNDDQSWIAVKRCELEKIS